jgi:hypothetical protein
LHTDDRIFDMSFTLEKIYQQKDGKHVAYFMRHQNSTVQEVLDGIEAVHKILDELKPNQVLHTVMQGYPPVNREILEKATVLVRRPNFVSSRIIQPNGTLNFLGSYLHRMAFARNFIPIKDVDEAIDFYIQRFGPNTIKRRRKAK